MKFFKIAVIAAVTMIGETSAKHVLYDLLVEDKKDPKTADEPPMMKSGACPKVSSNSNMYMTYKDISSEGKSKGGIIKQEVTTAAEVGKLENEVLICYKDNHITTWAEKIAANKPKGACAVVFGAYVNMANYLWENFL